MNTKVTINRLRTGVPGMDEVLGGGLPEFSFNLIAGQPGCGKTTLAHQIMFALATPERPALYFTVLGEPPLKMLRYQQQFDFFDTEAVTHAIRFISLSEEAMAGDLDRVLRRIVEEVTTHGPSLVFVDSFRSVVLANAAQQTAPDPQTNLQSFVQQLGMLMTSWQATTFLIGEYFDETDANPVFTVADGLIWLRQSVMRNSVVRKLEVMKMRGQATLPGLHTFRIDHSGVRVFALDSNGLVGPGDAGHVVVTGSHGGLLGGRPETAVKAPVLAALYNDAGIGVDEAGISRLPALEARGIAGGCVAADSARIGDAMSTWNDGVMSALNPLAASRGGRIGQS
ncbi:MAG: ATPase domain-containing protein, partial [Burkholderiales bacterium]